MQRKNFIPVNNNNFVLFQFLLQTGVRIGLIYIRGIKVHFDKPLLTYQDHSDSKKGIGVRTMRSNWLPWEATFFWRIFSWKEDTLPPTPPLSHLDVLLLQISADVCGTGCSYGCRPDCSVFALLATETTGSQKMCQESPLTTWLFGIVNHIVGYVNCFLPLFHYQQWSLFRLSNHEY